MRRLIFYTFDPGPDAEQRSRNRRVEEEDDEEEEGKDAESRKNYIQN